MSDVFGSKTCRSFSVVHCIFVIRLIVPDELFSVVKFFAVIGRVFVALFVQIDTQTHVG